VFSPLADLKKMRAGDVIDIGDVSHFRLRPMGILEVVRFACTSGASLSRATVDAASEAWSEDGRLEIPVERFRDEFSHVVTSRRAAFGLTMWRRMGVLREMVPELQEMADFGSDGHKDIWEHSIDVLQNGRHLPSEIIDEVRRLSGILCEPEHGLVSQTKLRACLSLLLHDVGKMRTMFRGEVFCPACGERTTLRSSTAISCHACGAITPMDRQVSSVRRVSFSGHEDAAEDIVREMLHRLRYSQRMIDWVARDCVLHRLDPGRQDDLFSHDHPIGNHDEASGGNVSKRTPIETMIATLRDVRPGMESDPWIRVNELIRWHIIASDSSTRLADQRRMVRDLRVIADEIQVRRTAEMDAIAANRPLLDGNELQSMFGMAAGPWIGEVHQRLRADRLADPGGHDRDRALSIARSVVDEMGGSVPQNLPKSIRESKRERPHPRSRV